MNFKKILMVSVAALSLASVSFAAWAADDHGHEHEAQSHDDHGDEHGHGEEGHEEGVIKLTPEQIKASGVQIVRVQTGSLSGQINVPGRIVPDAERMAQVVPKASGIVVEALKNLGDSVKKGDVLARVESREMAEAYAEYQAASRSTELTRTTHNREKTLWEKQVTAEQDYLTAKNAWQESQIALNLAKQKLEALGQSADTKTPSRFHELKSPIDGLVVERELTLGEFVDTTHKAFTVADLSVLWVEIAVPPNDLPAVKEGQEALIEGGGKQGKGKLIFISPVIASDTRTAKAIIELQNPEGEWRSGDFTNATIMTGSQGDNAFFVPIEALQTIEGKSAVFVKTAERFESREVGVGGKNDRQVEITSGLVAGEEVAAGNTFILKAEAGKSEAEHSH